MSSENGHSNSEIPEFGRICEAIRSHRCIPFFGAGASMGYGCNGSSKSGIPSGWQLTLKLMGEAGIADERSLAILAGEKSDDPAEIRAAMKLAGYDLSRAAESFLHSKNNDRRELEQLLRREVARADGPRPIHSVIAQLEDVLAVFTTNYDRLFEEACDEYGRKLQLHVHEQFRLDTAIWQCPVDLQPPEVMLHKMHGCVLRDNSMLITRGDYIRYLANWRDPYKGMPEVVRIRLPNSILLFLGYSVSDWNLLAIWEGILKSYPQGGNEVQSYAVMKEIPDAEKDFLESRKIKPIEHDLTEFAIALAEEFDLEIPQCGITRSIDSNKMDQPENDLDTNGGVT